MKKAFLAVLFGSALVLGACGSNKSESGSGDSTQVDGEKVTMQKCISCHGDQLNNGNAPDISKIGAEKSEKEILKIVEDGQGGMPPGIVKGDEAKAVAEWLATQK